jgi:MFS family permease
VIVAALFTVTYTVANPFASFGVFLPILADTFGWSRGSISLAMSINLILGGILGFVVGALADRHGPRGPLAATVVCTALGFGLASTVTALWQLHLYIGVVGGIGLSGFYVLSTVTVSRWFPTRRGLALGLVLTGFNLGFITGGPIAARMIEWLGWRAAWVVLGGGFCLVGAVASLFVTFPPGSHAAAGPSRWAGLDVLIRDGRVWALTGSWFLGGLVLMMLSVHVVPFARDQGIRLEAASLALAAYGLGAVLGRLGGGVAADRFGTIPMMWCCSVLQALSLVPLVVRPSPVTLMLVLTVFGLGFAAADTVFARAIAEIFGLSGIGAVFGVLGAGWRIGASLGPAIAGYVHDASGSYLLPFGAAPLAVLTSAVLFTLAARAAPPSRRRA